VNGTDCEVGEGDPSPSQGSRHRVPLWTRIVFLALTRILDSPEGDLLEYGLTLVIGDIKAVEDCLIDCVCTGLEICLYPFGCFAAAVPISVSEEFAEAVLSGSLTMSLSRSSRWG